MWMSLSPLRRFFGRAAAAAVAAVVGVLGLAPTQAAGLLVADGGLGGVLEVEEHSVRVTVNNGVAVTRVDQVFRNTEDRQVEALYTFPVPGGASVANFSMWIGGKEMVGEVVEKKRAREIYDSYKQVRRDPGLLEQADYKTFEMRIFPIGPKAGQRVEITYYQELDVDHDWATYVYPLATVTRREVDSRARGKFAFNLELRSAVPIAAMESPSHGSDLVIAAHTPGYYQASLETKGGDLNRDIVVAYQVSRPQSGVDLVASRQAGEDGYFCLLLTAGEDLAALKTGMDYVFVLDVSGSMADGGKLGVSRSSIGAFIDALAPEDRFQVVTFNVRAAMLFPRLTEVSPASKEEAARFLAGQEAKGGTVLGPALQVAYKHLDPDRPLNVVVLSDGLTDQGERDTLTSLIRSRPSHTRVFCVGVGNDVNRPLLEELAGNAGGLAAFISRGDNFERQARAFRRKLTRPVATALKLDYGTAEVYDVEPKALGSLFHGSPLRVYGRYRGHGAATLSLTGDVAGRELRKSFEVSFPKQDSRNPEIERMWAWHKVDRLQKLAASGEERERAIAEVVRLGEAFSIVCEHTSFLVLENDAEYRRWKIDRRNALRIQRDRKSHEQLAAELAALREKAVAGLGPESPDNVLASASPVPAARPGAKSTPSARPAPSSPDPDWAPRLPGTGPVGPVMLALLAWLHARRRRIEREGGRAAGQAKD
jgi:Ca-activated chloride channel family protein